MAPTQVAVSCWPGSSTRELAAFGPTWQKIAWANLVFIGSGQGIVAPRRTSALTAKFAWGGEEKYTVSGQPLVADDDAWALIGAGEPYESSIDAGRTVHTLAVFFDAAFVAAVRNERSIEALEPADASLDIEAPLPLGRRRLAYDPQLMRVVRDASLARVEDGAHVELLHVALDRILKHSAALPSEWQRLPCVRAATRAEIHRRLSRAQDFIASAYAEPIGLGDCARVAAMAPHHFLTRFRELFGETPHQALVRRRIERARWLLAQTDEPIAHVARAVGFASFGSFSTRFMREVGDTPRAYRRACARFGTAKKSSRQNARQQGVVRG